MIFGDGGRGGGGGDGGVPLTDTVIFQTVETESPKLPERKSKSQILVVTP